jgi:hypothetical protein
MTRPQGILKKLKIHIHGIPYIATFTILRNNVVDSSYYMLLGRPWLRDEKVTHDWGNKSLLFNVMEQLIQHQLIENWELKP